ERAAAAAAAALPGGARCALPRVAAPGRMHAALHAVAESELVIDETFAHALLRRARPAVAMIAPLTRREREVLQLLAGGMTNKEIASRLGVTDHTVKDRKSTRLNSSHQIISYAVFCLKKTNIETKIVSRL